MFCTYETSKAVKSLNAMLLQECCILGMRMVLMLLESFSSPSPMIEWHDVQHWEHVFGAVCCLCERAYATDLCHWCAVQYVQRDSEQFRSSVLSNPSSKKERERGEILLQNQRLPTSKLNLCMNSSKTQILWPLVFLMFPFVLVLTQYFTDSTSIINHNTVTVCNINLYHTD